MRAERAGPRRRVALVVAVTATLLLMLGQGAHPTRVYAAPAPPVITASDLIQTVGTACANCRIDVYANSVAPGNLFGQVVADGTGFWGISAPTGGPNVVATATDSTGTSLPSAPFATACTGPTCISGQYEATYSTGTSPYNHCTYVVNQSGDGTAPGDIQGPGDCTTAHGGGLSASINQTTKVVTGTVGFSNPSFTVSFTGTYAADGSTGSGTWDCAPSCGGPFTWSAQRVARVTAERIAASTGGTLTNSLGDTLVIPAGSLAADTSIWMQMYALPPAVPPPPGTRSLSRLYVLAPSGATFSPPAMMTVHYTVDDIAGGLDPSALRVMLFNPSTLVWEFVGGTVNTTAMTITFNVDHFSDYAIFDCLTGLTDTDGDAVGDVCDADDDNDGLDDASEGSIGTDPLSPDTDKDACGDGAEFALVPPIDPLNEWDFYSVPVPALFAAPNPLIVFKNSTVGAGDAQAVFAYFKAGAKAGKPVYDQDLNNNGIADGVEYDRTVAGPGMSGPPDGTVSATEAQLAFAQFKKGYSC